MITATTKTTPAALRKKAAELRSLAKKADRAAGGGRSSADIMADTRRSERDITPREIANPARRKRLKYNDAKWLQTYLPNVFYFPFTSDQKAYIKYCGEALKHGTKKCIAAPRGDGKSSILKYLALKYALYRQVAFSLIIGATSSKSIKSLASIKSKVRSPSNKELFEDFPLECDVIRYIGSAPSRANNVTVGGRKILVEWKQDWVSLPVFEDEATGHGPLIMSLGITSDDLQGCNIHDRRPDFVMLDDLDSRDSLASEHGVIAAKIEETIDKTVAGLGGPGKRLGQVMLCTITSHRSAAAKYSTPEEKPAWAGVRVKRLQTESAQPDLVDEYIALRQKKTKGDPFSRVAHNFYLANRRAIERGIVISNKYDFDGDKLPDQSQMQVSAHQKCLDYIADYGRESFNTEHQNEPPAIVDDLRTTLTQSHVAHNCIGELERHHVAASTSLVVGGVDVRKIELHSVSLAAGADFDGQIFDYENHPHGGTETTVAQAEQKILTGLDNLAKYFRDNSPLDEIADKREYDLILVDVGWVDKSWATQPVETFCMQHGLRYFLPAHGAPNYRSPKPSIACIAGDNWHINAGKGANRRCTQIIWNKSHWTQKVEGRFLTEEGSAALQLFIPGGDLKTHESFANHIYQGLEGYYAMRENAAREKKKWRKDHYFDSLAMALVAQSVELAIREGKIPKRFFRCEGQRTGQRAMTLQEMAQAAR